MKREVGYTMRSFLSFLMAFCLMVSGGLNALSVVSFASDDTEHVITKPDARALSGESEDEKYSNGLSAAFLFNEARSYTKGAEFPDVVEYILENLNSKYIKNPSEEFEVSGALRVKQLAVNEALAPSDKQLDTLYQSGDRTMNVYNESVMWTNQGSVPIYDVDANSDYYVAFADTMHYSDDFKAVDFKAARNNTNGESVDFIDDKETGLVYIPKSYIKAEPEANAFQVEFVQYGPVDGSHKIPVKVEANGISGVIKDGVAEFDVISDETIFPLAESYKALSEIDAKNIEVYINGNLYKTTNIVYDAESGYLSILRGPIGIREMRIVVNCKSGDQRLMSILNTIFPAIKAEALTASQLDYLFNLSGQPQVGDEFTLPTSQIIYSWGGVGSNNLKQIIAMGLDPFKYAYLPAGYVGSHNVQSVNPLYITGPAPDNWTTPPRNNVFLDFQVNFLPNPFAVQGSLSGVTLAQRSPYDNIFFACTHINVPGTTTAPISNNSFIFGANVKARVVLVDPASATAVLLLYGPVGANGPQNGAIWVAAKWLNMTGDTSFTLMKVNENKIPYIGEAGGAVYEFSVDGVQKTTTTDTNGMITNVDLDLQPNVPATITITETAAPEGFETGTTWWDKNGNVIGDGVLTILWDGTKFTTQNGNPLDAIEVSSLGLMHLEGFKQIPMCGIKIQKGTIHYDRTTSARPEGDTEIGPTLYKIINATGDVAIMQGVDVQNGEGIEVWTNENGLFESGNDYLQAGTYTIQELTAPEGHYIANNTWTVTLTEGIVNDVSAGHVESNNEEFRAQVRVQKADVERFYLDKKVTEDLGNYAEYTVPQGNATLAGAEFEIINKSDHWVKMGTVVGGKDAAPGEVCLTLTTNEQGVAQSPARCLPYGRYEIREKTPPTGYLPFDGIIGTINVVAEDNVVYNYRGTKIVANGDGYVLERRDITDERKRNPATEEPDVDRAENVDDETRLAKYNQDTTSGVLEQVYRGGVLLQKRDVESAMDAPLGGALLDAVYEIKNISNHSVLVADLLDPNHYIPGKSDEAVLPLADPALETTTAYGVLTWPVPGRESNKNMFSATAYCAMELMSWHKNGTVTADGVVEKPGKVMVNTEKFEAGQTYVATIKLTPAGGRTLDKMDVVINGQKATVKDGYAYVAFDAVENANDIADIAYVVEENEYKYKEYQPNETIAYIKMDPHTGKFYTTIDWLPYGKYQVTEIMAPEGYLLDDPDVAHDNQSYTFEIKVDAKTSLGAGTTEADGLMADGLLDLSKRGNVTLNNYAAQDKYNASQYGIGINGSTIAANFDGPSIYNQVMRGDVYIRKISDGQKTLAGIQFRITSLTTGESHVIAVDSNGEYTTRYKYRTNKNADGSWSYATDENGYPHTQKTNQGLTDSGVWFGEYIDDNGTKRMTPVNDRLGALPYDTYKIEELRSEQNKGYALWEDTFRVDREYREVGLNNIEDKVISIRTTATNPADGTHFIDASGTAVIVDKVECKGLTEKKEYRLEGKIFDKTAGKILEIGGKPVTSTIKFTAKSSDDIVDMKFSFDASALKGHKLVVFEYLYEEGGREDRKEFEGKTSSIRTTATTANGGTIVKAGEKTEIIDVVEYVKLEVGKEYTMTGKLINKETEEQVGDPVSVKFTPDAEKGSVTLKFPVNTAQTGEADFVVFEKLTTKELVDDDNNPATPDVEVDKTVATHEDLSDEYQTIRYDSPVAEHENPDDEGQTVEVKEKDNNPKLHTTVKAGNVSATASAPAKLTGTQTVKVVDEIRYENLEKNTEYKVTGRLMLVNDDKTTTEVKKQTATMKTNDSGTGTWSLDFGDVKLEVGKKYVVFEVAEREVDGKKEEVKHENPDDQEQTVVVEKPKEPKLGTTVKAGNVSATASTPATLDGTQTVRVVDEIRYEDLKENAEYKVTGRLMLVNDDKTTVEIKKQTATLKTNEKGTGTWTLDFGEVKLEEGKKYVVFEVAEREENGEKEEVKHENPDDQAQTVIVKKKLIQYTQTGITGYKDIARIVIVISSLGAALMFATFIAKRRKNKQY